MTDIERTVTIMRGQIARQSYRAECDARAFNKRENVIARMLQTLSALSRGGPASMAKVEIIRTKRELYS